jgi:hypothetical protein
MPWRRRNTCQVIVEADRDEKLRVVVEQDSPGVVIANVRIRLCISLSAHEVRRDKIDRRLPEPRHLPVGAILGHRPRSSCPYLGTLASGVSVEDMVALSSLVQTVKKLQNRGLIMLQRRRSRPLRGGRLAPGGATGRTPSCSCAEHGDNRDRQGTSETRGTGTIQVYKS